MAREKAKIAFYQIDSCGYYAWREQEPAFGELEDILNQLQHWGAGKQLAETKTYEVEEGATELPTYLLTFPGEQMTGYSRHGMKQSPQVGKQLPYLAHQVWGIPK